MEMIWLLFEAGADPLGEQKGNLPIFAMNARWSSMQKKLMVSFLS
jgi:hypothetical protein